MDEGSGDPIGFLMIVAAVVLFFVILSIPTKPDDHDKDDRGKWQ